MESGRFQTGRCQIGTGARDGRGKEKKWGRVVTQAHATLVRQPIVCLMGQCKLIVTKIWSMQWAHACA